MTPSYPCYSATVHGLSNERGDDLVCGESAGVLCDACTKLRADMMADAVRGAKRAPKRSREMLAARREARAEARREARWAS